MFPKECVRRRLFRNREEFAAFTDSRHASSDRIDYFADLKSLVHSLKALSYQNAEFQMMAPCRGLGWIVNSVEYTKHGDKQQPGHRLLKRNSDLCLSRCFVFGVEKFR